MKHPLRLFFLIILLMSTSISAAQAEFNPVKVFSLSDGSTLKGKLVEIRKNDGAYIIESSKLGTVAVHPDDVVSMANNGAPPPQNQIQQPSTVNTPPGTSTFSGPAVQQAQEMLLSDPSINQSLQKIMIDPEIMEILQDPQLIQAVMSMDPAIMQSNPKIQKLLQNPKMQEIIQKAGQKMMNQGETFTP